MLATPPQQDLPISLRPAVANYASVKTQISWLNDKNAMKYSEQRHKEHTIKTQFAYICGFQEPDKLFEIHLGQTMVGTLSIMFDANNLLADMGILISPRFHSMGIGLRSWILGMREAFGAGARKIEAGCMATNTGMRSVCLRAGMNSEGARPNHFLVDGAPVNLVMYGATKGEWHGAGRYPAALYGDRQAIGEA